MGSYPDEFPFGIMEVVELLHLRVRRQQANSVYVDCPFCGDRRGRMNVNFVKNVWRCNHCDEHGGMLALYAKFNHTTTSDAYWEIAEALCDNTHEEHARSGNEAQPQPVSTGSPSSGARAAAAGHSSSERKIVPQSDKASPAEIHQTLRSCWPTRWMMRSLGWRARNISMSIPSPALTIRLSQPAGTCVLYPSEGISR